MSNDSTTTAPAMKLSAAIREGSKLREQGIYAYFGHNFVTGQFVSCVLGAAYEATGANIKVKAVTIDRRLAAAWPVLSDKVLTPYVCPACGWKRFGIRDLAAHLNDSERWTREAIADYLEARGL